MGTVTSEVATATSPSVFLAIECESMAHQLQLELTSLGCECVAVPTLAELTAWLERKTPHLAIVSLDFIDRCGLEYCRRQRELLDTVPVAFFAESASLSFDKSLTAVRHGAFDVLTSPLSSEKLERIAQYAHDKASAQSGDSFLHVAQDEDVSFADFQHRSDARSSTSDCHATANSAIANPNYVSIKVNHGSGTSPSSGDSFVSPLSAKSAPSPLGKHSAYDARVRELESWILGSSPAMQSVRSIIAEVAETKANVMIYGASGTGKELVATAVHRLSKRSDGPFEPVNMTEIPHDLAESLLFGHEKGAFTGADFRQIGVCEAADGGTLFLDEIGEMALATQPKLLRFLQEGTVKRIGSRSFKKVDVRVITATNRDPETIVKEGRMREDLFFRLHVVPIYIPPLQDRPEDIEQLALLFLRRYVKAYKRSVEGFTKEALDIFRLHDWPGNVRQLENVVERLVVFAKGRYIDVPDIPAEIHAASMFGSARRADSTGETTSVLVNTVPYKVNGEDPETASAIASMSAIQRTERAAIVEALQRSGGHVIDAANLLGLGQATVYRKIKQYHIPHERRRRRRSPK